MAGLIPQAFIDDLIARSDIVELIGGRVPLKKAGREYRACCPFHNEKTPSFWVSPDKQFYHCFGCGAHGTALGFLMNYDRLSFPEAVEELAQRLGVEIPREAQSGGGAARPGDDLYELMDGVAKYWAGLLKRDQRAAQYVEQRGLEPASLEQFNIGYAANSWNEVLKRFGGSEPARRALSEAGLIVERDASQARDGDRYYDRFRDRIMFPIRDARGRTIAFGGRIIDQGEPKYLNSPETTLFHKGRELYGLFETRRARAPLKRLLVVEGYMDVVRLHQAGVTNAVATLGTATTPEHLKRVFRLVSEVVFAFDGDRAGRAAAWRALNNALPEAQDGRELKFLFLPEGEDPDSLVGKEGREAFATRLESALPMSEYLVRTLAADCDISHADGRARFAKEAQPLLAKLPDGVYRDLLTSRIAEEIKLPVARLSELWQRDANKLDAARNAGGFGRAGARSAVTRPKSSSDRGGLVTQAVRLLVHFPAVARALNADAVRELAKLEAVDARALAEIIDELRAQPAELTAQFLQRRVGTHGYERLAQLATQPALVADSGAAAKQLEAAVQKILAVARDQRYETLLKSHAAGTLSEQESLELQALMRPAATKRPPNLK
jgi:DNA primase